MKNHNTCRYFLRNNLKKLFIVIAFILNFAGVAVAYSYTVSNNVNASSLSGRTEDTLYIDAVVTINTNETWDFTTVLMRTSNGTIFWANNSNLLLPNCTVFNIQTVSPGLEPTGGNASQALFIAGVRVAVSNDNSNNAAFSFAQFTELGGLPKFTLTSNSPICNGSALSITATPDRSSTFSFNYNWTISPSSGTFNPVSSNSLTSATTTISPSSGSYTITCKIYATNDPLATLTTNVIVNALPVAPTSVTSSPGTICINASSNLKATSAGNSIQWYTIANGGTSIGTSASGTNFLISPVNTTTYYAETFSPSGCKSITRTPVAVTVNTLPMVFSVTGGGIYCSGSNGLGIGLSGSQSGVNYQLYKEASPVGSAVAGTGSAISFGNKTLAGTYTVAATNAYTTCTNNMTGSAVIAINSRPGSVISPLTQSVCNGSSATINIALTGTAPWTLTYFDGSTSTTVNDVTNSPYILNISPNSAKTYTITALSDANCTSIAGDRTGNAAVTINERPTGALNGLTTICKGTAADLNLAVTGSGIISGTFSDGTVFAGSAPSITATVSPTATTSYSIATLTNGTCSSTGFDLSGSQTVTVNDPVVISIIQQPSDATFCAGSDASFYVTASCAGPLTYKWQVSANGITYTDISGEPYSGTASSALAVTEASAALSGNYYRAIVTSPLQCTAPVISNGARLLLKNYWIGLTNSDWNTASNWSENTVPTLNCPDIYISGDAPYQPSLTGTTTINNIIIKPGAVLTIKGIIQVAGTITNSGTFDVTNGAIEFNGSSDQSIPANVFYNNTVKDLIISNNVSLAGPASLTGVLSFGSTAKLFTTNGNLTLKSTAANTSVVGPVINGNSITGEVTVERYIPARRAWYYLSIPTHTFQSVRQAWKEGAIHSEDNFVKGYGTQVTDNTPTWEADGFDYFSPDGPSVKKYNPITKTYIGIANTSVNIASKEGWMTFVRGDRTAIGLSAISTPTVLRTKGSLHVGTQPVISIPGKQFIGIGNPYASPIDMRKISKSGLPNVFYLWDPNLGTGLGAFQTFSLASDGNYKPTPGGGSYPAGGGSYNYIQSGLAFFVLGDVATGTVTFTENSKASLSSENIVTSGSETENKSSGQLRTNVYASDDDKIFTLVDGTLNLFADKYDDAVDINDAKKIPGFDLAENISIKADSDLLAVERRHAIDKEDTIRLNIEKMKVRNYRLQFIAQDFDPSITAFLEDSYNNTRIPLNINGTSVYDFNVMNIADSWNPARFRIVFKPGVSTQLPITHNPVMTGHERSQIIAYPNPATDGNINLQLMNQPKGVYGIKLINKLGQVIMTKQIEHVEGSSTETFRMNKTLAHGSYQLEVIKPDNSRINIKVLH